ncbi:MAG: hypothetical protein JW996_05330 [Candidatus Cloacimonetes bacterium]|nr:hypothetical protein [Candidatus Cloacimonadota bacterium]
MILKVLRFIVWISFLALFAGCSLKYLPQQAPGISVSNDIAILDMKDFLLLVENKSWNREPENLADYFTTFYISISNKTDAPMTVDAGEINLLDQSENQYDVIPLNYIEQLLLPEELEFSLISDLQNQPLIIEQWREAKQNLITHSFSFGMILPGAKKSGYVFFPKLNSQNQKCHFFYRNFEIVFFRKDYQPDKN